MANPFANVPCEKCGCTTTQVIYTGHSRVGSTRRRRKCTRCAHGFITYEISATDFALLKAVRAAIPSTA